MHLVDDRTETRSFLYLAGTAIVLNVVILGLAFLYRHDYLDAGYTGGRGMLILGLLCVLHLIFALVALAWIIKASNKLLPFVAIGLHIWLPAAVFIYEYA